MTLEGGTDDVMGEDEKLLTLEKFERLEFRSVVVMPGGRSHRADRAGFYFGIYSGLRSRVCPHGWRTRSVLTA